MASGDFENQQAFEYVIRLNVKTIEKYTTDTREIVRDLETEVKELKKMMAGRDTELQQLITQISIIQGKLYNQGTE
jgi:hypothetical protein